MIPPYLISGSVFELVEEGCAALLHHLLKLVAETAVFGSAVCLDC